MRHTPFVSSDRPLCLSCHVWSCAVDPTPAPPRWQPGGGLHTEAQPTRRGETIMAIPHTVESYIAERGIPYDVISHEHSHSRAQTAELAHVPGDRLAKSVILEDDAGYVMAVLPSTCHVRLGRLSRELNRKLRLATEKTLPDLFG